MIFNTAGLQAKYGFDDGLLLCDLLEANGYEWTDDSVLAPAGTDSDFTFDQLVLIFTVIAYVAPKLDQPVDVELFETHNPIRVTEQHMGADLRPLHVEVPDDDILRLAATLHRPETT